MPPRWVPPRDTLEPGRLGGGLALRMVASRRNLAPWGLCLRGLWALALRLRGRDSFIFY